MLRHHLKVAIRNISKNRLYSFINIAGLAIGMACSILIFRWVQNELDYDTFIENSGSIYRLNWEYRWNGSEGVGPTTPPPLAAKLVEEVPEATAAVRVYALAPMVVRSEDLRRRLKFLQYVQFQGAGGRSRNRPFFAELHRPDDVSSEEIFRRSKPRRENSNGG